MKSFVAAAAILFCAAVQTSPAATQAECVQRCSSCGNSSTCDAIFAQCMSTCTAGTSPTPAPRPDVWGAVAVSPSTLFEGHAFNYKTQQEAETRALKECRNMTRATDCKIVANVVDVCIALAESKPDKVYAVSSPSPGNTFADKNAILHCQRAGGRYCAVVTSLCADGVRHQVYDGRVLHR